MKLKKEGWQTLQTEGKFLINKRKIYQERLFREQVIHFQHIKGT